MPTTCATRAPSARRWLRDAVRIDENLLSGSGDDLFLFANGSGLSGSINAGGGIDRFDFNPYTTGLRINIGDTLTAGLAGVVAGRSASNVAAATADRVRRFEHVTGGGANDVIVGNSANDYSGAHAGRNVLIGNGGDDTIFGVGGSDIIIGDFATVSLAADGTLLSIAGTNVQSGGNDTEGGDSVDYVLAASVPTVSAARNDQPFGDNGSISLPAACQRWRRRARVTPRSGHDNGGTARPARRRHGRRRPSGGTGADFVLAMADQPPTTAPHAISCCRRPAP